METQNMAEAISEKMCRMCLCQCDVKNSVDIFYANDLSIRIMACAGLEVTQQDALPKRICLECRLALEKSFLFRNKCKNSDSKLRRHFRLINAGKESRVFAESEDEFEDDYTESLKLINDLENRMELNMKIDESIAQDNKHIKRAQTKTHGIHSDQSHMTTTKHDKIHCYEQDSLGTSSAIRTRSSNRLQNFFENKNNDANYLYESSGPIEVLVEEVENDQDVEYVITDTLDELPVDHLQSINSNDDLSALTVDENEYDQESYELQNITKTDAADVSEDSMDAILDCEDEEFSDENNYDAYVLETILPQIKQLVETNSGTLLDNKTKYKIKRSNGNKIKVQCIASDGKEFEIEMVQQPSVEIERDESGDLKIFKCSKCPKTFSRRGKLLNHERDHSAKSNGQECPYCQKWFPSNSTLTRHIRVHTGEKPFACNICHRSFIQKEILKRHLMTHSGERPFKCAHCSKSFILKEALRQHINRNHTENPTTEMHNCPFCTKSFCHSSGLSRHLLIHAGKTFDCVFCFKKFNDKSALKRHTASIHNAVQKSKKN